MPQDGRPTLTHTRLHKTTPTLSQPIRRMMGGGLAVSRPKAVAGERQTLRALPLTNGDSPRNPHGMRGEEDGKARRRQRQMGGITMDTVRGGGPVTRTRGARGVKAQGAWSW